MSVLAVGVSHRTAPVPLLERVALSADDAGKLLADLAASPHVGEALVLSTCNRVEVYAEVAKFHAGVQEVSELLARVSGVALDELAGHLYVHYEDRAVQHLFTVACGLDSMVVGEAQILGQLRAAYTTARAEETLGRSLGALVQQALRVGKRAHAETGIDRAGQSLVSVGLDVAASTLGPLVGRPVLLVGSGSMASLAGATLRRLGVDDITVVSRTPANAGRLARTLGGRGHGMPGLAGALDRADVVVCATGATGVVLAADTVAAAMDRRGGRPLFLLDLALPRDVDPAAREIEGVSVTDLDALRAVLADAQVGKDVEDIRRIVTEEVAGHLAWQRASRVDPMVVALRTRAATVVDAELHRLAGRVPDLDEKARAEVASTVRRVVDKLLHTPTVRVRELAGAPGGDAYADALRELFQLDPAAPEAVARADVAVDEEAAP